MLSHGSSTWNVAVLAEEPKECNLVLNISGGHSANTGPQDDSWLDDYSFDGLLFVSDLLSVLLSDFDSLEEPDALSPDFESDLLPDLA